MAEGTQQTPDLAVADEALKDEVQTLIQRESRFPLLQEVLREAFDTRPSHDLDLISKAYHFAELAHRNQYRKSGRPFINHATEVARILVDLNQDSTTVAAGLLHDVVEDTGVQLDALEAEFNLEIAELVDGVTKIRDLSFESPEAEQAENFRKMLLSMARDIRVVLIKFADRLHNMRTLDPLSEEKRRRMATESRDIYAPLAHRLGIARVRWELEDLSLKWLEPEAYREIQDKINLRREEREAYIEDIRGPLQQALQEAGIQGRIEGRAKNFLSIFGKIKNRGKSFEEIYDLTAVRIIVGTIPECYNALGLVHTIYTPVMARFKDFIATPKSNMYQSLHTTVVGPRGMMLEIQIRTHEMHQTAEVGIAAHWRYKEGRKGPTDMDRHMAWLRSLVEWQQETTDPHEFIEELKVDLFPNEIYVFTPRGDLIQLPQGATPVDFAFAVHSDVGLHCTGARVDDRMVPLATSLETGATVEIITSAHQRPSRDWLAFVKSAKARSRIRRWLREEEITHSVRLGQEMLERELKRLRKRVSDEELEQAAEAFSQPDVERLYAAMGNGVINLNRVIYRMFPEERPSPKKPRAEPPKHKKRLPLKIHGLNHLMIHFARCCNPILGDPILGIITRGKGVSVHRRDCANIRGITVDPGRIVELDWDTEREETFVVKVEVTGNDRPNFLRDVTQALADAGVPVVGGQLKTTGGRVGDVFTVQVKNRDQLRTLYNRVLAVPGVLSIERVDEAAEGTA